MIPEGHKFKHILTPPSEHERIKMSRSAEEEYSPISMTSPRMKKKTPEHPIYHNSPEIKELYEFCLFLSRKEPQEVRHQIVYEPKLLSISKED